MIPRHRQEDNTDIIIVNLHEKCFSHTKKDIKLWKLWTNENINKSLIRQFFDYNEEKRAEFTVQFDSLKLKLILSDEWLNLSEKN